MCSSWKRVDISTLFVICFATQTLSSGIGQLLPKSIVKIKFLLLAWWVHTHVIDVLQKDWSTSLSKAPGPATPFYVVFSQLTINRFPSKTLPKVQQIRGLSSAYQSNMFRSYHKFKHKSWLNFIFRISTKYKLQNLKQMLCSKSEQKLYNQTSAQKSAINCCQHGPHHPH